MAISVGWLVFIGIVLLLILVVLLCIGTDGSSVVDAIADRLKGKHRSAAGGGGEERRRQDEAVVLEEFRNDPAPRPAPETGHYAVNPDETEKVAEPDEEDEYDIPPTPRPSVKSSDKNQSPEEDVTRGAFGEDGASEDGVYQNTKITPAPSPRPAPRGQERPTPTARPRDGDMGNGDSDKLVYQNVSIH